MHSKVVMMTVCYSRPRHVEHQTELGREERQELALKLRESWLLVVHNSSF